MAADNSPFAEESLIFSSQLTISPFVLIEAGTSAAIDALALDAVDVVADPGLDEAAALLALVLVVLLLLLLPHPATAAALTSAVTATIATDRFLRVDNLTPCVAWCPSGRQDRQDARDRQHR